MKRPYAEYHALKEYVAQMLEHGWRYPVHAAEITAKVLVEADARGHASHGVARLGMYDEEVSSGKSHPEAQPEILRETPVSLTIDGHSAPGFPVSQFAMERTLEKARQSGVCMTAVRESCHFGMAGYWAEMAADAGMMGIAMTNTTCSAIPFLGRERLLGTNPLSIAIPTGRKPHFLLDMATTTVAFGKIEVAARRGGTMPVGWAVAPDGADTTDALFATHNSAHDGNPCGGQLFLGGASEVLGGHKGYGLGLVVELMTAGFSMGCPSWEINTERCGICHYFQAVRLDLFDDPQKIQNHVASILERLRSSPPAEGQNRIYIHGEKEQERRIRSMSEGVWLDEATWDQLDSFARRFKLPLFSDS